MNKYTINHSKFGTHRLIAEEISEGKAVLDVGCNEGYLKMLCKNNPFYGLDLGEHLLKKAKENGYLEVSNVNLNNFDNFQTDKKFEVIVFGDILEHLLNPEKVLDYFVRNCLAENGIVIISLPNVAHISARINLLFGKFDYTEDGILDRTHLHLYTSKTARALLKSCSLDILKKSLVPIVLGK